MSQPPSTSMIAEDLKLLQAMCQDVVLSVKDGHASIVGLEARYRDTIQRLDKPMARDELQGLTTFLLENTIAQRQFSERQILAFATVVDALQPAIEFFAGIPEPNAVSGPEKVTG